MSQAVLGGSLSWKIKYPQHSYRDCVLESVCGSGVQGRGYSFQISHGAVVKLTQQVAKKNVADVIAALGAELQPGLR